MSVKVTGGYLKLLQRVLQHYQIDLFSFTLDSEVLQQFNFALLQPQSEAHFDVEYYAILLACAQKHFQRPFALVMAEHANLQDVGLVGYLASTSMDVQQALQFFEQYYPLIYDRTNTEPLMVEQDLEYIMLKWHAPIADWQIFYELNIALIYKITESIVQEELIPPNYIVFGYPLKMAVYHYEKFFKTYIRILENEYGICFSVTNLKVRNIAADEQLNQVLSNQAKHSLEITHPLEHHAQQFKHKIMVLIEKGFTQDRRVQGYVAEQLHCSERTLQRQLKVYQLNFQNLVDDYRFDKSQQLLRQGRSFSEVAERLHYADQSAFSRAFKRWSGLTPKQYLYAQIKQNE